MNAFHIPELAKLQSLRNGAGAGAAQHAIFSNRLAAAYEPVMASGASHALGYQVSPRFWAARASCPKSDCSLTCETGQGSVAHELGIRRQQIRHAPQQGWLMLDLDAAQFCRSGLDAQQALLQLFGEYAWSERDIIVNLVGSCGGTRCGLLQEAACQLQQRGIAIAIADGDVRRGAFTLDTFLDATALRFDCGALHHAGQGAPFAHRLLELARGVGMQVIATGVDDLECYELAGELGADGMQGRLFRYDGVVPTVASPSVVGL